MEENKEKKPDVIIEKKNKEFKTIKAEKQKNKKDFSKFNRNFAVPFLSGILGAGLVLGTCFGVPAIRHDLLGKSVKTTNSSATSSDFNTNLLSLSNYSETGVAVAQKLLPSIVGIRVEYPVNSVFMSQSTTVKGEGSGIIISSDGYILTNNHVINSSSTSTSSFYAIGQASKVSVFLYDDETEYPATVVGSDEVTDLAVIKIDKSDLTAAELGDSDSIQVGEFAMAIGNPLGMQSSVTAGMISAKQRDVTDSDGKTYKLIQTDAAINSGNSGGALVNSQGKVIGINTLKVSATGVEGMGFAIPINSAKPIYQDLIQYNKVKRPYVGFTGRDYDKSTATLYNLVEGVYVVSVEEYSAGEKAGLKAGDVITKVDDKDVKKMSEINAIKNAHAIGDSMTLTINRNGQEKKLTVVLTEQP